MSLLFPEQTVNAIEVYQPNPKAPFKIVEGIADWVIEDMRRSGREIVPAEPEPKGDPPATKTLLHYALDCLSRGWFVFPCYPKSKAPAGNVVPHGVLDASNDAGQIRAWWAANPNFNPAIALGPSNLVVYDFDSIKPFENLPATFTVKTGRVEKDGIGGIQMYFRGSCKTHGHAGGGGEVRGRGAYVMAPGAIHPRGNPYVILSDVPLAESPEQNQDPPKPTTGAITTDEQATIATYVEAAFEISDIDYQAYVPNGSGGLKWYIACPWKHEHTTGTDFDTSSAVIMWPSGKLIYECKHAHCNGKRQWKEVREWMEAKVGHFLVFGDPDEKNVPVFGSAVPQIQQSDTPSINSAAGNAESVPSSVDETSEEGIPPFDPSVVNGVYAKFVELVTRGTTLAPQYAYVIAKTLIGLRMAGKVKFENLDVEPRFYTALIGATGSGKGESFRRIERILRPEGAISTCKIKIIHSADSGAGLADVFFEVPEDQPVLCYSDEVETLGNKSRDTRNPGILDAMIELADSTSISRVLAKSKGGTKTKYDARFGMVMCGQDGSVYMKALAGRTKLGLWDRFTPEYSVPQETGDLPPIDPKDAIALLAEFNSLDYSGVMKMSPEAKTHLEDFWKWQSAEVRKKARWKKNLQLDAYMSAFGCGRKTVEPEDVAIAIKIFQRQLVIRKVCFTTEVPDRTGYYLGLIKRITERMKVQLAAGVPVEAVAKSRRDFETETNAYRDNEIHLFERAWQVFSQSWLDKVKIRKANGQEYMKFVPVVED